MSKVIKCDVCGSVDLPEETFVIDLIKRRSIDRLNGDTEKHLEICSECFDKILEVLRIDKQEYNEPID